jgi:hypothetical protein
VGLPVNKKSHFSAFLTAILIGGLVLASAMHFGMVKASTDVSDIPTPSVPEFTFEYVDNSYDVPPTTTTTINPYNNQTTTITVPGYHVKNMTIDLTIRNQLIPLSIEGNKSYLLFYVRLKGHYGDNWIYPYTAINSYPLQSNSDYTVISFPTSYKTTTIYGENIEYLQAGDQIDFQIKAILAYGYNFSLSATYPVYSYDYVSVAASDWSKTQTITIEENQTPSPETIPTSSPAPTSSPYNELQQNQQIIIGVAIVAVVIGVGLGLLIYLIKRK